jgi:DNA repair exonuclease SbcCD ATPase subunit
MEAARSELRQLASGSFGNFFKSPTQTAWEQLYNQLTAIDATRLQTTLSIQALQRQINSIRANIGEFATKNANINKGEEYLWDTHQLTKILTTINAIKAHQTSIQSHIQTLRALPQQATAAYEAQTVLKKTTDEYTAFIAVLANALMPSDAEFNKLLGLTAATIAAHAPLLESAATTNAAHAELLKSLQSENTELSFEEIAQKAYSTVEHTTLVASLENATADAVIDEVDAVTSALAKYVEHLKEDLTNCFTTVISTAYKNKTN